MDLDVHSLEGGSAGTVSVPDELFAAAYNEPLVHQVVTAYLAGGRRGTKAQKTRSQVRGGGAKPWRQKGLGRARAGSIRSPLWRGGGKSFAARPRSYEQKLNRKMYRQGLRSIVSELLRQERLLVVDDLAVEEPKTRRLAGALATLNLAGPALLVVEELSDALCLAARNLPGVEVCDAIELDPVSLVRFERTVITQGALKVLEARLAA